MTLADLNEILGPSEKLAAVVVAIAAMIGLYQLILTKRVAQSTAKREAFKLAAEQCSIFARDVMPMCAKLMEEIENKKLLILKKAPVDISNNKFRVDFQKITKKDLARIDELEVGPHELLNKFEAFALYFTSGIAAERPAFLTLGCAYCDMVQDLAPFIGIFSDDDPSYENTKALYWQWRKRREKLQHIKKLSEAQKGLKESEVADIQPIGTKV